MSYATVEEWEQRAAYLSAPLIESDLDPQDILNEASGEMNRWMDRPSLEPKTVAALQVRVVRPRTSARHVHLPDWPPHETESWFFTLTTLELFDVYLVSQGSVDVSEVQVWPAEFGTLILPSSVSDGSSILATYDCGYGDDKDTPGIPADLREACLLLTEAKYLHWNSPGNAGAKKAMAYEKLGPWAREAPRVNRALIAGRG